MSARLTPHERQLRSITEAAWQRTVTDLATRLGWRWYAPPKAGVRANGSVRTTVAGWPDLVLLRGPRLIFAELKTQTGRVRPEQTEWLDALREVAHAVSGTDDTAAGIDVCLWRPSDLDSVRALLGTPAERAA